MVRNLKVNYLSDGNIETDVRVGVSFRWKVKDGVLNVFERDENHQIVWTKCYINPIYAESTKVEDE